MRRRFTQLFSVLLLLLVAASPAIAQTTTASLRGTVEDESGNAFPGAEVSATNVATGYRNTSTATSDGSFSLGGLTPGRYRIDVSAPSYNASSREVTLLVGQNLNVNFRLTPNLVVMEEMTVVGSVPVEMETHETSLNVTRQQIENLPQSNRNFLNFAGLAPGVVVSDDEFAKTFKGGAQTANAVNVFVDGVSFKNDVIQGGVVGQDSSRGNPFPQNAVQEFRAWGIANPSRARDVDIVDWLKHNYGPQQGVQANHSLAGRRGYDTMVWSPAGVPWGHGLDGTGGQGINPTPQQPPRERVQRSRAVGGVGEQNLDIAGAHVAAVDAIDRAGLALDAAGDFQQLAVVHRRRRGAIGIVDRHRHFGVVARRAVAGTGEDHRVHVGGAQRLVRGLAHRPAQRLDQVRLAAAVRPDDTDQIAGQVDRSGVDEGFETDEFDLVQAHGCARYKCRTQVTRIDSLALQARLQGVRHTAATREATPDEAAQPYCICLCPARRFRYRCAP